MRNIISNNPIFSKLVDLTANVFIVAGFFALAGCSVSYPLAGLIDSSPTASLIPDAAPDKPPAASASIDMTPTASISPMLKPKTNNQSTSVGSDAGLAAAAISPLALHLQSADLGSARSALNLALSSQSSLQSVAWSNPVTGSSGAFMPVGQETAAQDMVCRNFKALLHPASASSDKKLSGAACKNDSGQWIVKSIDVSKQDT